MDINNKEFDKLCPQYNKSFYLSETLVIIFIILIIISLVNLEKSNCECAKIPEKRFLKEWFIISLIVWVLIILFFLIGNEDCYIKFIGNNGLYLFILIFGLVNYIMLFRLLLYLRKLRNGCECGYGNIEKILFWYLVIMFSFIALMILLGLIMILVTIFKFR